MRPIKFRFQLGNRETGEVILQKIALNNENSGLVQYPIELDKWAVLSIDEYTGLKDRNGKEIYEGDIVITTFGRRDEVYFHKGAFWIGGFLASGIYEPEIIGNIYEHSELLGGSST